MFEELLKNGIPAWVLLVIAGGFFLYITATVWTQLEISPLFWQNLLRSNKVALPKLAQQQTVPLTGSEENTGTALVLSKTVIPVNPDLPTPPGYENIILPVAGRNGLHFAAERCTSCGLCSYVCPTKAVTTEQPGTTDYTRRFDLEKCIFCGLCEATCPTWAIKLTLNEKSAQTAKAVVEGQVEAVNCTECGRLIPQEDLLANRLYEMENPAWRTNLDRDLPTKLQQAVNPEGVCEGCQKQVLEAEERICG